MGVWWKSGRVEGAAGEGSGKGRVHRLEYGEKGEGCGGCEKRVAALFASLGGEDTGGGEAPKELECVVGWDGEGGGNVNALYGNEGAGSNEVVDDGDGVLIGGGEHNGPSALV